MASLLTYGSLVSRLSSSEPMHYWIFRTLRIIESYKSFPETLYLKCAESSNNESIGLIRSLLEPLKFTWFWPWLICRSLKLKFSGLSLLNWWLSWTGSGLLINRFLSFCFEIFFSWILFLELLDRISSLDRLSTMCIELFIASWKHSIRLLFESGLGVFSALGFMMGKC